ncbi:tyrosine-type recombinase/integrase [Turicimonas muris]|uniref:tyrosine-type recombinase/integrase n=1 Tax=Turicimonas muris TaxID=1796652 RepID=UPI003CD00CE8
MTPEMIRDIIGPLWETKTNTAQKALTYLRQIFNWSIALRIREDRENPADLRSALGVLLEPQKRNRREKENHAAISVEELPALYAALDKLQGTSPRACQFAILTASRSKAVRLATWDEFDLENKIWNIPLEHDKMKQAKRDRTIPLSDEAVQLLKDLPRYTGQTKVFLSNQMQTLSDMTMSMVLRRLHKKQKNIDGIGWIDKEKSQRTEKDCIVTPHGCARATFRTWAKDDTIGNNKVFDQEAVELCLLHSKRDVYNGAYDRARLLTERRKIMDAWGKYCISAVREKTSQIKDS